MDLKTYIPGLTRASLQRVHSKGEKGWAGGRGRGMSCP